MSTAAAINAYKNIGMESGVIAADPHQLISKLYQGALLAIADAKSSLTRRDIAAKGAAISKAIVIIDTGLSSSLNKASGGGIAQNLAALYEYISARLVIANLNNDVSILDEVAKLLTDLKEGWEAIRQPVAVPAPA